MKLYFSPGACSFAPHIALHEAGAKFDAVPVNLRTGQYAGGDFKQINPKGYVPTLQLDNGEILTEGATILQYIGDSYPAAKILPAAGDWNRYRCLEWLTFVSSELHKSFGWLWNDKAPEEAKQMAKENISKRFDYVADHLQKNSFLMGSQFSVADAYLYTVVSWTQYLKFDMSRWPKILDYMERVKARPSVQAAQKAENLK